MKISGLASLAAMVVILGAGCTRSTPSATPAAVPQPATGNAAAMVAAQSKGSEAKDNSYTPPTAEEMAPIRPEYLAELAKIHEPPEMAGKPMQVRKAVSSAVLKANEVLNVFRSPEKATQEQRARIIGELLEVARGDQVESLGGKGLLYSAIAVMACINGAEPQTVIGYTTQAMGDMDDAALALRARMYLRTGERRQALDDLERIMADGDAHALIIGGDATPRRDSAPCEWSLADLDALGDEPRGLAAKGFYLSAFIGYGAEEKGLVKESDIRNLYLRSGAAWHSPIPHVLALSIGGLGSEESMARAGCLRADSGGAGVPKLEAQCAKVDEATRQEIRELTMALVIDPTFTPALSERASRYLRLAQGYYGDGKPSRQVFELAIRDYTAAIAAGAKARHTLYCDRGLALASVGRYQEAAVGYEQGMKHAKGGVEDSPFVYEQLAGLYMKLRKYQQAADLMTQAIMNVSGGGMDAVTFMGGMRTFRILYPEYDAVPDEILAEDIRRRYQPQFPHSWDAEFIAKEGAFDGKIASTILPDLFALRGDAYMKAGRPAEALADYRRLKSDAWSGQAPYLPAQMYFTKNGARNYDLPGAWPPPAPAM